MKRLRAGIIGVSGYTGAELLKILLPHPHFEITLLANSQGQTSIEQIHPEFKGIFECEVKKADPQETIASCDIVFLALPHKSAMEFVKGLGENLGGLKVVDLSADYRLSAQNYEKFYCPHSDLHNLQSAVYGLPEYAKREIANASLVANPGCYPTATLLAIVPFLPFIKSNTIFVDAKSGVSGAGKKLSDNTHFPTINENIFAYSPLNHRHQIEMEEKCAFFGNRELQIHFIPHLIPITRGMLVSVFAELSEDIEPLEILQKTYKGAEFVRICESPVRVSNVCKTNMCDIFASKRGNALYVNSAIDNLMRGASSQAVVNANLMCGFPADCAIPKV